MCFSAPASFAASGVLAAAGVATVKRKPLRRERLFAIIPFLFAFQQALEGLQWLAIKQGAASLVLGYGFLFFAFLLWPSYIPITVYKMERKKKNKQILRLFIITGLAITVYLLIILLKQPLDISVVGYSIRYLRAIPLGGLGAFVYLATVSGSLLASSDKHIRWFGWALLSSFFVAFLFFRVTLISTWCFFAAVLSFIIYLHFRQKTHQQQKK